MLNQLCRKRQYLYSIVFALIACSMSTASAMATTPAITLTSPVASSTVSGTATIACAVNSNVVWVNFYIDGAYLASGPPFIIDWNSTSASNGSHTIAVTAYGSNNVVVGSASVTVNVNNSPPTSVTVSAPTSGSAVSGSVTIISTVGTGVLWVNFYIDDVYLASGPPFNINWDSTTVSNGSHTISVTAYGSNNVVVGSASVTINVNNGALTYYVSSSSGSDSNTGIDSSHPWQTLGKVAAMLGTLKPGQAVLFRRGDTWTAGRSTPMISLPSPLNGTASAPIVFSNYGSGALPVFDGGSTSTGCFQQRAVGNGSVPLWSYITIDGFECRNTTQYGVLFYQNAGGNVGMPGIVVRNMNIHNTGPGAYAGAIQGRTSASNATCSNSPQAGPAPCDDGAYRNQLMFLDENSIGGGVQFINNTVDSCGGHNCIQVQGDTKGALEQGNTCYGWVHNCMDVKVSQNAVLKNNICHQTLAMQGACYYYENDYLAGGGSVTFAGNVAYSAPNGIQCESGGSNYLTHCNVYNNTLYLGRWVSAIVSASTANVAFDVRNNIFDTSAPLYVCNRNNDNSCGAVVKWDYNDDGGLSGGVSGLVTQGAHDQINTNPLYVNSGSHNFQLRAGSPEIGAGLYGLTAGTNDIGAY